MTLLARGASAAAAGLALCACAVMVTSTVDGGHRSSLGEKLIFKEARFPEQFTPTGWADLPKSNPRRSQRSRALSGGYLPTTRSNSRKEPMLGHLRPPSAVIEQPS